MRNLCSGQRKERRCSIEGKIVEEDSKLTGDEAVPQATPIPLSLMLSPALMVCVAPKTFQEHLFCASVVANNVLMMRGKRILNVVWCSCLRRC